MKREQKLVLAGIDREQNTPATLALRVLPALLYGPGHPYGNPLTGSGTKESVAKLTREDLVKFHDTWLRPNNSTLIVVGDTTLKEVTSKLEKLFAGWKSVSVPAKNVKTVSVAAKSAVYLIDKPGALQSVIIAGVVAPPRGLAARRRELRARDVLGDGDPVLREQPDAGHRLRRPDGRLHPPPEVRAARGGG